MCWLFIFQLTLSGLINKASQTGGQRGAKSSQRRPAGKVTKVTGRTATTRQPRVYARYQPNINLRGRGYRHALRFRGRGRLRAMRRRWMPLQQRRRGPFRSRVWTLPKPGQKPAATKDERNPPPSAARLKAVLKLNGVAYHITADGQTLVPVKDKNAPGVVGTAPVVTKVQLRGRTYQRQPNGTLVAVLNTQRKLARSVTELTPTLTSPKVEF